MNRLNILMSIASLSLTATIAQAGNERGGGVPPAPIFMPENASYKCDISLTQEGSALKIVRPLVSHSSYTFTWKKGEYAGRRGIDLKDIKEWKHAILTPQGPFGRAVEVEIPTAPNGALFDGYLAMHADAFSPRSDKDLTMNLTVSVRSNVIASDKFTSSRLTHHTTLQSKKNVVAETMLLTENRSGDYLDQRTLSATCVRVP